jgi:uncharacterized ferritin-like protein (DUF455 family)
VSGTTSAATGLGAEVEAVLREPHPERKLALAEELCDAALRLGVEPRFTSGAPLRPARPAGFTVTGSLATNKRPDLHDPRGRRSLIHSVAHIELSAVELALMAAGDFPGEPRDYYADMLNVAREECAHARLLIARLRELGGELGEEPVHLGLWETAARFRGLAERLAIVPRVLEAKGLDVSAPLRAGLRRAKDEESARCLDVVYRDEVGHVAVGSHWFRIVCERDGVDPERRFLELARPLLPRRRTMKLDLEGRRAAGFSEYELAELSNGARAG